MTRIIIVLLLLLIFAAAVLMKGMIKIVLPFVLTIVALLLLIKYLQESFK